jgi:hypothetical protein
MSNQVTAAFVQQYAANVYLKAQQMGSRLRGAVRNEKQVGVSGFYDQIGAATASVITSRHADTLLSNTPHARRMVTLVDYGYADLIDQVDRVRLLIDPTSPYTQNAVNALGRSMDSAIIAAASATSYIGQTGSSTATLASTQKVVSVDGSAGAKLNVSALRAAKAVLDGNDVDPSVPRYCVLNAIQLQSLLGQTEVTSSDYNVVKALVQGEVDTFLGFKFIRTQLIANQSSTLAFSQSSGVVGSGSGDANGYNKVLCFAQDGILLATGMEN